MDKLGRYDIIRVLGKGAMGLVYEARDPNLDRRVAIKTIKVDNLPPAAVAEYEARFRTEARSAARLQHPNIVSVYDSERHGDTAYLVMEYVEGQDLKHHLDGGARYTLEQTGAMVGDLLKALDYAHAQKIVHRDVKPANLLLVEATGRIKLTDFGVARITDGGEATRTKGAMVGTLKYMSPEQVRGRNIDYRADLFSAGVVLYQLLTNRRPFDGDSEFAIIQQIIEDEPAAPSSINDQLPRAMDAVVSRALAKDRERRFASAAEFAQALRQAMSQVEDTTVVLAPPGGGGPDGSGSRAGLGRSRAGTGSEPSGSTVTQELELVYWKDVKDSTDPDDLLGYLDRFPQGVYTDLARRRLRRLQEAAAGNDATTAGTRAGVASQPASPLDAGGDGATIATSPGTAVAPGVAPVAPPAEAAPSAVPGSVATSTESGQTSGAAPAAPAVPAAEAVPDATVARTDGRADTGDTPPTAPDMDKPSDGVGAGPKDSDPLPAAALVASSGATPAPVLPLASPLPSPLAAASARAPDAKVSTSAAPAREQPAVAAPAPSRSKTGVIAVAAVVVIAGSALALKLMGGGSAPAGSAAGPVPAASSAATSTSASTTAAAGAVAAAAASTAPKPGASAAVGAAASAKSAPVAAAKPATAASAPAAKTAAAPSKATLPAPASPAAKGAATADAAKGASTSGGKAAAGGANPASPPAAAATPAPAPASGSPAQACEGRVLIGYQLCMNEQCAKPAFNNHPICVQRRENEKHRANQVNR